MGKLDEQKIKGFDKYEDKVFHYTRYLDRIKIWEANSAYSRITIYKDGTFDIRTIGENSDVNEKRLDLSELGEKYHYDYYSIKNFMETTKSEKDKFLYLYKMSDDMYELAYITNFKRGLNI